MYDYNLWVKSGVAYEISLANSSGKDESERVTEGTLLLNVYYVGYRTRLYMTGDVMGTYLSTE